MNLWIYKKKIKSWYLSLEINIPLKIESSKLPRSQKKTFYMRKYECKCVIYGENK